MHAESLQSCPTLCDCSLPGSSVRGILQARILGWVVISSSRGSSQGSNLACLHWQADFLPLGHLGSSGDPQAHSNMESTGPDYRQMNGQMGEKKCDKLGRLLGEEASSNESSCHLGRNEIYCFQPWSSLGGRVESPVGFY